MPIIKRQFCRRAIGDVARYGDNDVLPFDIDNRFFRDEMNKLTNLLFTFSKLMEDKTKDDLLAYLKGLSLFSERLLAPTGYSGFRITTKIHPFWNAYFNALAIAVAELHEPTRSTRAHSYRYLTEGDSLFDRDSSWRSFREATILDCIDAPPNCVVVETDISSFYEHVYHHRLQNFVSDLLPYNSHLPIQIDRILNQFAAGRSFGLPVGGQAARILAEILLSSIDRTLTDRNILWRRYVDDFVIIARDQHKAYQDLGILANALADLGLSLNRSKTTFLSANH